MSCKKAKREFDIGIDHTTVDWRNFLRDICAEHFIAHLIALGVPGATVEIDESLFCDEKTIVVGYFLRRSYLEVMKFKPSVDFSLQFNDVMLRHCCLFSNNICSPGTTVCSDLWRAYNTVGNIGYQHLTVNHSIHYVDPNTGVHINNFENIWRRAKRRNKRECGTHRHLLDTYLIEYMWRLEFGNDPFENILSHIRECIHSK